MCLCLTASFAVLLVLVFLQPLLKNPLCFIVSIVACSPGCSAVCTGISDVFYSEFCVLCTIDNSLLFLTFA